MHSKAMEGHSKQTAKAQPCGRVYCHQETKAVQGGWLAGYLRPRREVVQRDPCSQSGGAQSSKCVCFLWPGLQLLDVWRHVTAVFQLLREGLCQLAQGLITHSSCGSVALL